MWQLLLRKTIEKNLIKINSSSCLRSRHKNHSCQHCIAECPNKAISMENNRITVDESKCESCGSCCHLCPTGVFYLEREEIFSYEQILHNKDIACFSCRKQGANDTDILLPCLKVLSPEFLMMADIKKIPVQIYWNEAECNSCGMYWDRDLLIKWVDRWNATQISKIDIIHSGELKKGINKEVSRREFFSFVKNGVKLQANSLIFKTFKETSLQNKVQPTQRKQYFNFFVNKYESLYNSEEFKQLTVNVAPTGVRVNDQCDLCGKCSVLCPTGAIAVEGNSLNKQLVFDWAKCINCCICGMACSNIQRESISFPFTLERLVLKETIQKTCSQCGDLINEGETLCMDCKLIKKRKEALLDSW